VRISESLLEGWQGEFIVVWRMPPGYLLPTSEGSSGATVDWLGAQLSIYDGLPALAPAATFDKSFAERVQSFQKSVNLAPTGIVGPHTWVHLNSIEGIGVPFLAKQQELTPGSDD
jgi:general secretion pathway protein A